MNCARLFEYLKFYLMLKYKKVIMLDIHKIYCTEHILSLIRLLQ